MVAAREREIRREGRPDAEVEDHSSARAYGTKECDGSNGGGGEQRSLFTDKPQVQLALSAFAPLTFATFFTSTYRRHTVPDRRGDQA